MTPSASCWRTFSLSSIRTWMMISDGSEPDSAWNRIPSQPWPASRRVATVSAKTKKAVLPPRVLSNRSSSRSYS